MTFAVRRWLTVAAIVSSGLVPTSGARADDLTTTTTTDAPAVPSPDTTATTVPSRPVLKPGDVRMISRINTKDPVVFITIDDGSVVSPELAEVIDKNRLPVTSFAMPGMVWRARKWFLARKNMTFENHTNTHAHMTLISPRRQVAELCRANKLFTKMVGRPPVLYRPPRGSWNEENKTALAKCGLRYIVLWSVVITKTGATNHTFRKGDIILFHYIPSLPGALQSVVDALKVQGLRPALLRDYLKGID